MIQLTSILLDNTRLSKLSFRSQISACILEFSSWVSCRSRQARLNLAWKSNDVIIIIWINMSWLIQTYL